MLFRSTIVSGGRLFINSSLIDRKCTREDIEVYYIPANEMANDLGNARIANMVMLGAFLEATNTVSVDTILNQAFTAVFGENKAHLKPINKDALEKGAELVRNQKK